ncbi:MAG: hypothetical protein L3J46_04435 [Kangiellaceae bacterium]|nr:hypothetical protein [Kangiellaceae bacterium]
MKSEKFFKWVWNINGLLLLTGILLMSLLIAYQLVKELSREEQEPTQTLNLAEDSTGEEKWSLGYPQKVVGSPYYYLKLESENKEVIARKPVYSFSGSGYRNTRAKNVLFINSNSNVSNWLFKSVRQLIINMESLHVKDSSDLVTTKAIYYEVINNDTNSDGVYDIKDKKTFALTRKDGTKYSEIISGYNNILTASMNEAGALFVIYINNGEVHSMLVDVDNFIILEKTQLPKVSD